jgi:hypothetical protein
MALKVNWFRRDFFLYWKTWVAVCTPLALLPLLIAVNTPVRILLSNIFFSIFITIMTNAVKIKTGSKDCLCHTFDVCVLDVGMFTFSSH